MLDTKKYIQEVYEKYKTMPLMEEIKLELKKFTIKGNKSIQKTFKKNRGLS